RGLDLPEKTHAVHALHAQVREHEVGARGGDGREGARTAIHGGHVVSVGIEANGEEPEEVRIVVDEEQRGFSVSGHQRGGVVRSERLFSMSVRASSFCCNCAARSCRASARCFSVSRAFCASRSRTPAAAALSFNRRRSRAIPCKKLAIARTSGSTRARVRGSTRATMSASSPCA